MKRVQIEGEEGLNFSRRGVQTCGTGWREPIVEEEEEK